MQESGQPFDRVEFSVNGAEQTQRRALCRNEARIYTQFQCELVELAVLKYWNVKKRLPQNLAELSAVNLEKEAWIDPLTGQPFSYEVTPGENRFQVLHGGKNWGSAVQLSRK